MKTPVLSLRPWYMVLGSLIFAPGVSAGSVLDFLFPGNDLQTITVTDTTPAGNLQRQPSPGQPLYYAAVSAGYYDFGGIKAGEKPVSRQLVDRTMLKILAKQGYLPAPPNRRPDIVVAWTWGTMNIETWASGDGMRLRRTNSQQLLRFLGGEKLGLLSRHGDPFPEQTLLPGLLFCSGNARNLLDTANDDLYVAAISAYAVSLRDPKHAELLWNTRISAPSRGFWLPEALPAMLAIASPYVGRETSQPVWIRATDRFKPDIHLGDLKVVEYLERAQPTVAEIGPSS